MRTVVTIAFAAQPTLKVGDTAIKPASSVEDMIAKLEASRGAAWVIAK